MRSSLVVLLLLVTACSTDAYGPPPEAGSPPATPVPSPSPAPSTRTSAPVPPEPGTVPPAWLGTRPLPLRPDGFGEVQATPRELRDRRFTLPDTLDPLAGRGFAARVEPVPPDVLARSTWQPDCPVAADELSWVRLTFWGFDDARHTGELLVNARVADDLVSVFRRLYETRYPIEEMRVTRLDELDAAPTGDGNNTGAFACRATVNSNGQLSQHAYGLALDLNSFQNPYEKGDLVLPELASSYLDRDDREGVIHDGDVVVAAFAEIGWEWGGDWQSLKDYQHFSANGR